MQFICCRGQGSEPPNPQMRSFCHFIEQDKTVSRVYWKADLWKFHPFPGSSCESHCEVPAVYSRFITTATSGLPMHIEHRVLNTMPQFCTIGTLGFGSDANGPVDSRSLPSSRIQAGFLGTVGLRGRLNICLFHISNTLSLFPLNAQWKLFNQTGPLPQPPWHLGQ